MCVHPRVADRALRSVRRAASAGIMSNLTNRVVPQSGLSIAKQALLSKLLRGRSPGGNAPASSIPRRKDTGPAPLSFEQQQLWFFDQLEPESPLYNMPIAMRLTGA